MIANYIQNNLTTKALENQTPLQVWTRRKLCIHYFRNFGCNAYVHNPKAKRKKFDPKSQKYIFVNYNLDI
jgi:hypothetical protein